MSLERNISTDHLSYEHVLFTALVNEKKHLKLLSRKRQGFTYNEKQLRDEAAAEVALLSQQSSDNDDDLPKKRHKGRNDDKNSKQNRDRNREHARNTRLRKKVFLQKLQDLCENITAQRNKEIEDRLALGKRIHQTQELRMEIVKNFLFLRASNVQDISKQSLLLDENFMMTLPITPYMAFNKAEVVNSQRVLIGINSYLADVASLAMMIETVGFATAAWTQALLIGQGCRIWYEIGEGDIIPAADVVMCRFFMRTEGHDRVGASTSLAKHGMLRCRFNKKNKIISAEMTFDVMSFMQQFQRSALLTTESSIVPNTLEMAMQPTSEARLVADFRPPYRVVYVNRPWCKLRCRDELSDDFFRDKTLEEVLTMQHKELNRNHTELISTILACIPQVCRGIPTRAHWIYTSPGTGQIVLAYVRMIPISNDAAETSQFLLILYEISLPAHISSNPLQILSEPVVDPKISFVKYQNYSDSPEISFDYGDIPLGYEEIPPTTSARLGRSARRRVTVNYSDLYQDDQDFDKLPSESRQLSKPEAPRRKSRKNY